MAKSWGVSFGKMEECCVKWRRGMGLKTQTTGRKLGELDLATKTWEYFRDLKAPKNVDAKMRRKRRAGSLEVRFRIVAEGSCRR